MIVGGTVVGVLCKRVAHLDDFLGSHPSNSALSVYVCMEKLAANINAMAHELTFFITTIAQVEDTMSSTTIVKDQFQTVEKELDMIQSSIHNISSSSMVEMMPSKIDVSEPNTFHGTHNANCGTCSNTYWMLSVQNLKS